MRSYSRRVGVVLIASTIAIGIVIAISLNRRKSADLLPQIPFGETVTVCWPESIVERGALPVLPRTLRVYRVQSIHSMKAVMIQVFRALPIELTPQNTSALDRLAQMPENTLLQGREKDGPMSVNIGGWHVEVWPNGQFSAEHSSRFPSYDAKPAPTEALVRQASDKFLSPFKPLFPLPVHFSSLGISHSVYSDKYVILTRSAVYTARLGKLPAGGVSVEVAAGSKVVDIDSNIPNVVVDRTVPILSPQEAIEKLRAHEAHLADGEIGNGTGYVDSIQMKYWVRQPHWKLSHLMPVYEFKGEVVSPDKSKSGPWKAYVQAVRPEFLEKVDRAGL